FDEGFDVKLMKECEYDWTVIPRMYNLHVFDWRCTCGHRVYMGPYPDQCEKCDNTTDFEKVLVWKRRRRRKTDFARFDRDLKFQYWRAYGKRSEAQGEITDVMSSVGACWLMHRDRFWELGGCDEGHGSWGQFGVEFACKAALSGGRHVVNKQTWFAHMFRTQPGFSFPYPNKEIEKARQYSRDLWLNDKWPGAKYPLSWLLEKFYPVPGWHESKGIVFYTDNRLDDDIARAVQTQIKKSAPDIDIVSVSLAPLEFGRNIVLEEQRGILTMFK
ncbi:unnamed protein product, partial [marine sediment metagenome]